MEVASIVSRFSPKDTNLLCAAVLHDVLEDCGVTSNTLTLLFGSDVSDLVCKISENKNTSWKDAKRTTLAYAFDTKDIRFLQLLFADSLSNLISLYHAWVRNGDTIWDHFCGTQQEFSWYFKTLDVLFDKRMRSYLDIREFKIMTATLFGNYEDDANFSVDLDESSDTTISWQWAAFRDVDYASFTESVDALFGHSEDVRVGFELYL